MSDPRIHACSLVFARYRACEPAQIGGPSIFHGWPGLVLLGRCIRDATGSAVPELDALAWRWRAAAAPLPALPSDLAMTFVYGQRGRVWAEHMVEGRPLEDSMPPPLALGIDTLANDGPVFFAWHDRRERLGRAEWSAFIAAEHATLEHAVEDGRAIALGFAHGVAGLLLRALLLLDGPSVIDEAQLRHDLDWLATLRVEDDGCARWPARRGDEVSRSWVASSLCNGSLGHALLYLEAFARLGEERYLGLAQRALAASADEDQLNLGFCCGHAGRAAVVSRFLRLGVRPTSTEAEGTLERLVARVPHASSEHGLGPLSGLASCLPALHAEAPDSPVLDVFLPAPLRS